jgi:hypothetical protein
MAKKNQKKQKGRRRGAAKVSGRAKVSAQGKRKARRGSARKARSTRRPTRTQMAALGSQSVETLPLRQRARAASAGAGAADYSGISTVESADSESPEELLEEGQTFEAGIVEGVQNARDADAEEVTTHEVPQDDVPEEYEDKDRP